MSDDVLPLKREGDLVLTIPGYPRLRLWPDAVTHLDGDPDARRRLLPNWDKRYLDLSEGGLSFHGSPTPLKAVYLLSRRASDPTLPSITAVKPASAIPLLAANTYRNELLDREMRQREFLDLGAIVRSILVRKVVPHQGMSRLPALCEAILADFEAIANE